MVLSLHENQISLSFTFLERNSSHFIATTLESEIYIEQGINVGTGKFGKNPINVGPEKFVKKN